MFRGGANIIGWRAHIQVGLVHVCPLKDTAGEVTVGEVAVPQVGTLEVDVAEVKVR